MFLFLLSFLLTTWYLLYQEMTTHKEVVMVRFEGINYDVPLSVDYLLKLKEDNREQIVHISAPNCKNDVVALLWEAYRHLTLVGDNVLTMPQIVLEHS
jgi:hypothetical protein